MCSKKLNRWYWKCGDCLTPIATDVDVKIAANVWNNSAACYSGGVSMTCGACGGPMWLMGRVAGGSLVQDGVACACACDARCTNAIGPNCDCQCGGVNHGTGRVVDVVYDCGAVPVAKVIPAPTALANATEYRAMREVIAAELAEINSRSGWLPRPVFDRKRKLLYVLSHSAGLTSHAGRMKCLRESGLSVPAAAVARPTAPVVQACFAF